MKIKHYTIVSYNEEDIDEVEFEKEDIIGVEVGHTESENPSDWITVWYKVN